MFSDGGHQYVAVRTESHAEEGKGTSMYDNVDRKHLYYEDGTTLSRLQRWSIRKIMTTAVGVRVMAAILVALLLLLLFGSIHTTKMASNERTSIKYMPAYHDLKEASGPGFAYQEARLADEETCRDLRKRLKVHRFSSSHCQAEHALAPVGNNTLFSTQPAQTYRQRFSRYTDSALGTTYRNVIIQNETIHIDPLLGPIKPISYSSNDWSAYLKRRMAQINSEFKSSPQNGLVVPDWKALSDGCGLDRRIPVPQKRTAVLFRFHEGFVMSEDQILDLRAMLTEMVVNRPEDGWNVRILVEIKETKGAFISKSLQEKILTPMCPREFWGLVEFWSEEAEKILLPGIDAKVGYDIKRSCLLATQLFSFYHPEYDFVYNWEADVRFIGNYSILFDTAEDFARREPLYEGLDKYQYWLVNNASESEARWLGKDMEGSLKESKEADLLTFNAIKDMNGSGWFWSDVYGNYSSKVPRLVSVLSSIRFSRALLKAMNLAIVEGSKSMQCEAWPATVVLHSQMPPSKEQTFDARLAAEFVKDFPFKAVFVPHPVYLQEDHPPEEIEESINAPDFLTYGGLMKTSSFDWTSSYGSSLYTAWRNGQGEFACRRPSFTHPVKYVGY